MPNEFEKQVQQMMDELKLVPSEPVWQKVELQIRKKKDRRRLIFWLPLLTLLLGGGLWIGVNYYSNNVSYNKNNKVTKKEIRKATDDNLPVTINTKPIDQKSTGHVTTIKTSNKTRKEKIKEGPKAKRTGINLNNEPDVQNNVSETLRQKSPVQNKKDIPAKVQKADPDKAVTSEIVVQTSIDNNLNQTVSNSDTVLRKDTTSITSVDTEKTETVSVSVTDSVRQDTALSKNQIQKQDTAATQKADIKKYAGSKWKLNLVATAGSSNMKDLNLFNGWFGGQKSLATAPNYSGGSQSGGLPLYYGPSDIKEGFSFAVGAIAKKQLAKRTFFSAGLRYNYYSNTIYVGNRINQNRVLMDFAVSRYYSNTGISLQPYHNRYHFVSVPAAMDWQLLKKIPLNFHTGLSMQYLVKTNGLVFDNTTQSYFYSKHAFKRVQLFFEPALTYSVSFKQKVLTFGPQLQYGLSRLEKNNSTYHLTSYGLKAQLQLGKK